MTIPYFLNFNGCSRAYSSWYDNNDWYTRGDWKWDYSRNRWSFVDDKEYDDYWTSKDAEAVKDSRPLNSTHVTPLLDNLKVDYYVDEFDNIIAIKGKPLHCFCCHTDDVQDYDNRKLFYHENIVFGMDLSANSQCGIGGDDKCGIHICLKLLETCNNIMCVFFADEETGGNGSQRMERAYFGECRYIIELDRKGSRDAVYISGGKALAPKEFIINSHGFKPCPNGVFTDLNNLTDVGVPMLNLSCGFYNAHTDTEYVDTAVMLNTYKYCMEYYNKYKK